MENCCMRVVDTVTWGEEVLSWIPRRPLVAAGRHDTSPGGCLVRMYRDDITRPPPKKQTRFVTLVVFIPRACVMSPAEAKTPEWKTTIIVSSSLQVQVHPSTLRHVDIQSASGRRPPFGPHATIRKSSSRSVHCHCLFCSGC